jgi:hypothetical protein
MAPSAQKIHGCRLALGLAAIGESESETYEQLLRWHFPPELARDCAKEACATALAPTAHAS